MGFAKGAPHTRPAELTPAAPAPPARHRPSDCRQTDSHRTSLSASLAQHVLSVTRVLGVPAAHASSFGVRAHTFPFTTETAPRPCPPPGSASRAVCRSSPSHGAREHLNTSLVGRGSSVLSSERLRMALLGRVLRAHLTL